jgi:hypothetical protein
LFAKIKKGTLKIETVVGDFILTKRIDFNDTPMSDNVLYRKYVQDSYGYGMT